MLFTPKFTQNCLCLFHLWNFGRWKCHKNLKIQSCEMYTEKKNPTKKAISCISALIRCEMNNSSGMRLAE